MFRCDLRGFIQIDRLLVVSNTVSYNLYFLKVELNINCTLKALRYSALDIV